MMFTSRFILVLVISLVMNHNVSAQSDMVWADSIFSTFCDDASKSFKGVRKYADTLSDIYARNGEQCKWIRTKIEYSYLQMRDASYKETLHTLNAALARYQQASCKSGNLLAEIYLTYACLYENIGEPRKSDYYVQLGISAWEEKGDTKETLIRLYMLKATHANNPIRELQDYRKAYNLALQSDDIKMQETLLNLIGTYYAVNGRFKEAESYLKQSLSMALARKAYSTLPGIYNNLAGLTEDEEKAAIYVDSSHYYGVLSGSYADQQIALENKALLSYNKGKYKIGYDYLWEAMVLKDSVYNLEKINAFADMEQKYESEKKSVEIALLKNENEITGLRSSRRLLLSVALAGAVLAMVVVIFGIYRQRKKEQKLNTELLNEKKKSDDLLLNILPEEIADELKANGEAMAKQYNNVTVLFTDFVNFTGISEQMTPTELVKEIHRNFKMFDAIIEANGLEKIKTIGDAYLAVCGLPHETADHAQRVAKAALAIVEYMNQQSNKFTVRIGIHTGPVVAGIVGVKKFAYDIWGDTVNTASRMESCSEAGKINISVATYELIKEEFNCEYRGKINAKNKGEVDMYFVMGYIG